MSKYEYATMSLEQIVRFYIKEAMIKADWEILAIDTKRDVVIFQRFEKD